MRSGLCGCGHAAADVRPDAGPDAAEAGPDLILSGGIPATVFGTTGSDAAFVECVQRWLDTRRVSSRLIMAAGNQVPPDAPWPRIAMLPDLVARYGGY